jgi:hypothetical protein
MRSSLPNSIFLRKPANRALLSFMWDVLKLIWWVATGSSDPEPHSGRRL